MTREDYADISIVLDRSGSMSGLETDMVGGLRTFLDEQRKIPGKCIVSLYQFDNIYETVFENKYVHDIPLIRLVPRDMTALRDAIGKTINRAGERFRNLPEHERPSRVFVIIITDGYENASREFNSEQIRQMIEHQKGVYNWNFVYIGSNQDSILTVQREMGLSRGKGFTYDASSAGITGMFRSLSFATSGMRCMEQATYNACVQTDQFFSDEDRKEQEILLKKVKRTSSSV